MAKVKKTPRPKAQTPKGFRDYAGPEVAQRDAMLGQIAEVYHRYGFEVLETSAVETVEAWANFCQMWSAQMREFLHGRKKKAIGWPCGMI